MSNGSEHMSPSPRNSDTPDEVDQDDLDALQEEGTEDPYQGDDWNGVQDPELADD